MAEYVMEYDGWAEGIPVGEYLKVRDAMHARKREEVVRCRDCEYFEQGYTDGGMFDETVCWAWENGHDYPSYTNPDGFCHCGKRRESE